MDIERNPERGGRRDRFEQQPTELSYAQLRIEPGMPVEMDLETLARLIALASDYHRVNQEIEERKIQQGQKHEEIEKIVCAHPALRGIIDEKANVVLTVYPQERKVQYNEEILRLALGSSFKDIVRRRFRSEIPDSVLTPTGEAIEADEIVEVIRKAIAGAFGIPEEEVARVLNIQPSLKVDEERLEELLERGQVELPEGAKVVGEIVWTVRTDDLRP